MSEKNDNQPLPRVAMLGVGSMGGAILAGLRGPGEHTSGPITVTMSSSASAAAFAEADDVVAYAAEETAEANRWAVRGAQLVILAVKPWLVHDVLREVADDLEPHAIVVSVAAGITTASMEALLPAGVSVVRAMPNTPANVGRGVTGVAGGASASPQAVDAVRRLFQTVGAVIVLGEERLDALGAVSGSGPAYLFLFVEEFTAAAERLGFSPEEARVLVQGTVMGASDLMSRSTDEPAELRRRVTSPNGTTERAIEVLQSGEWGGLFDRAFAAAIARSHEISQG
ncbi:pyrroline-5-carboxylate reductase [Leucobacter sp. W1153]|uniref:pyrroline-5-carboxylate reductase n=1 Tax=Leucobacter sp. W1153 TaxID=3439064 RepID=UPI003F37438A